MTEEMILPPAVQAHRYTRGELAYAWLMLAAGYGFCRMMPLTDAPLGGLLWFAALTLVTLVFLLREGRRPCGMAWAAFGASAAVSLTLFLSANPVLQTAAFLFCLTAYALFVSLSCGNAAENGFSDLIGIDTVKAVLVLPFSAVGSLFSAVGTGKNVRRGGIVAGKIILGVSLAVMPTVLVFLLLSYDGGFLDAVDAVFSLRLEEVFSHIGSLILGIPVAMLLFGLWMAARENRCREQLTGEACRAASAHMKLLSPITAVSAAVPVLFLYAVFFFSQWEYYMSAFRGVLPGEETMYAAYARDGFFQLCAVAAINMGMLAAASAFTGRDGRGRTHIAVRMLHVVLSVFSLVLIATAVSKLLLYIRFFGLTPKRVYAAWLELLLAVVFLLIIVKQFVPRLKLIAWSAAAAVVLFAALGMVNADARIAEYNVSRYLDGTLTEVDTELLADLGDAGIPALVRLITETQASDGRSGAAPRGAQILSGELGDMRALARYLETQDITRYRGLPEDGIFGVTLPYLEAKRAMERWRGLR